MTEQDGAGRSVALSPDLVAALERRIAGSGFRTIEEFVTFVLARLVDQPSNEPFSEDDERRIRERLRSLGYID